MKLKTFESFSSIENKPRLSEKINNLLNEQINYELYSAQLYLAISCWLDSDGWISASNYYFESSKEELTHREKIYKYIFSKNCKAVVKECDKIKDDFKDIREIVEFSLEHEMKVTEMLNNISEMAKKEGDNTTYEFIQWFLSEQTEEEERFRNILFKMNLDMPKYEIDKLFEDLIK